MTPLLTSGSISSMSGDEVKAVRRRLELSQRDFAKRLGVSFVTVARWETDQVRPSPLAVGRIKELAAKNGN